MYTKSRIKKENFNIIIILVYCICSFSCKSSGKPNSTVSKNEYSLSAVELTGKEVAKMQLIDSGTFKFGNVNAGSVITHVFRFKNSGKIPLIITSAMASCGCTVARFNKLPIAPSRIDSIVVVFKSAQRSSGFQNKVIEINYNSLESPRLLTLYGRLK